MKRSALIAGLLWLGLTVLGEALVWNARIFPAEYAREARVSDSAFRLLMRLAVPVFAFVVAMLVVSVARFRVRKASAEDGPALKASQRVVAAWLSITSLLAVVLIVNPGLVGLADIRGEPRADMVVRITAARWFWTVSYPEFDLSTTEELVLPVGERIRFDVESTDVVHSFWIPAFRVKIDAVPGRTTNVYATPNAAGSFPDDPNLRIQCAELCGLGHATMALPVRVVQAGEFQAWVRQQQTAGAEPTCSPSGTEIHVKALNIAFDTRCLAAPADRPFEIVFDNADVGVPHNVSIALDAAFQEPVFTGEIFNGSETRTYRVAALVAGRYYFRCDVHPAQMSGVFVVG